jgi:hypothetical protein
MKMRLTISVLLISLLLVTAPVPGLAAGASHPAMNHCVPNSYALAYPAAGLDSSAPRLAGYAIPYPPADLDGDSHNCLAGSPTRSGDGHDGGSFVRYVMPSLDTNGLPLAGYAIPYPSADLDGDSSPSTVRYVIPYPSADWGDSGAYLVR